jgi:hypothetical protein
MFWALWILDFGFFLNHILRSELKKSHVPKAVREIANVFKRQLLFMIINNELTLNWEI